MTWRAGLTRRGWALLVAGILACAGAWFTGQRDLWWPGLFMVALPVGSRLILLPQTSAGRIQRQLQPATVSLGESTEVRLRLDAHPGLGGAVQLRDRLPAGLGAPVRLSAESADLVYQLRPERRGRYRIGPVERRCDDGLGLARTTGVIDDQADLVVTPPVVPLANLGAASGMGIAPDTTLLRTGQGSSDDVLIREYRHGDDVRRIHWRSTARTGELMVRREERARNPVVTILIDNRSRSFGATEAERFEQVVTAAASLGVHLVADGFDVSLVGADGASFGTPRAAGAERQAALLEHLAELDLVSHAQLNDALATCRRGSEGQLLIAVLGRLDAADVTHLSEATGHGSTGWALLVDPSADDLARAGDLAVAGWRYSSTTDTGLAEAWRAFGRQGTR